MTSGDADDVARAKRALRSRLLAQRADPARDQAAEAAEALCRAVLALPEVARAGTVGCYVSTPGEPGTGPLLDRLRAGGVRVILPVLMPDFDLDWAEYEPGGLVPRRFGLEEPGGPPLGVEAIAAADVVVCPGLAVDSRGRRLGKGGGSYDRALARARPSALRVLLLYDDEVLDVVPAGRHDQPVHVTVTPTRVLRH